MNAIKHIFERASGGTRVTKARMRLLLATLAMAAETDGQPAPTLGS